MGDFNGIGPEIALKAVADPVVRRCCLPVLIGSMAVFEHYARSLGHKMTLRQLTPEYSIDGPSGIPVVSLAEDRRPVIRPGTVSEEAGGFAAEAITEAARLALEGVIDGIVTAPVSKDSLARAGYHYPGQTEFLADLSGSRNVVMMLVADSFRVGLATVHVPLRHVSQAVSAKSLVSKLRVMDASLRRDLGISAPTIAVLGLNPHAGEGGHSGARGTRENPSGDPFGKTVPHRGGGALPRRRFFRIRQGTVVRCHPGDVSRSGAHPPEDEGLRYRGELLRRTAHHPHFPGPRHCVRYCRQVYSIQFEYERSRQARRNDLPQPLEKVP